MILTLPGNFNVCACGQRSLRHDPPHRHDPRPDRQDEPVADRI